MSNVDDDLTVAYQYGYEKGKDKGEKENALLREDNDFKQAKVDSLMLEYCPNEMTKEQIEEWEKHQKPII